MRPFETVVDLRAGADVLRMRRYGVIEMVDGRLRAIRLRPWPKLGSWWEARLWGHWFHARRPGDQCRLYYNQPRQCSNYLALRYVVSTRGSTLATFHGALEVLDRIAELKRSDAIVCQACNPRISDRLLARWGWEPHAGDRRQRHFIKRFYGKYPTPGGTELLVRSSR